ncbi:MAG: hypothetical protein IJQ85_00200 [Selenomonadaceae bacterium]|nr:hypothetical protein [Selenomonadaceae bacterium]
MTGKVIDDVFEAVTDDGRPQQKQECFFAGTCGTGCLNVETIRRQRPCEVPFLCILSLGT